MPGVLCNRLNRSANRYFLLRPDDHGVKTDCRHVFADVELYNGAYHGIFLIWWPSLISSLTGSQIQEIQLTKCSSPFLSCCLQRLLTRTVRTPYTCGSDYS